MHPCIWVKQWAAHQSRRRFAKSHRSGFGAVILRVGFGKPDIEQGFRRIVRNLEKEPCCQRFETDVPRGPEI